MVESCDSDNLAHSAATVVAGERGFGCSARLRAGFPGFRSPRLGGSQRTRNLNRLK